MKSIPCITFSFFLILNINLAQEFEEPVINPFSLTDDGSRSSPTIADLDNDGDLDILIGLQSGDYGLFDNIGTSELPSFGVISYEPFSLGPIGGDATPFLIDMDDDGDYDVISGGDGGIRYFENTGTASVPFFPFETSNPWDIIGPSGISKPYLVDIDNDGDPDIFSGATDGNIYYYENSGSLGNPIFEEAETNPFGFMNLGLRTAPAFSDMDNDGDFDALIGSKNGTLFYFENIGSSELAEFDSLGTFLYGISSAGQDAKPSFSDLDADGDQDLIIGNTFGEFYYYENLSTGLGVKENELGIFTIYPNPANTQITIDLSYGQKLEELTIFNQIGQLIFYDRSGVNSIDISNLDAGIYLIEVITNKSKFNKKLIIK